MNVDVRFCGLTLKMVVSHLAESGFIIWLGSLTEVCTK
jgi:hypothetical protein